MATVVVVPAGATTRKLTIVAIVLVAFVLTLVVIQVLGDLLW